MEFFVIYSTTAEPRLYRFSGI